MEKFAIRSNRTESIYLHLDIDDFDPSPMSKNGKEYEVVRAVPKTNDLSKFFISHRGIPRIAKEYDSCHIENWVNKEMRFTENSIIPMKVVIA